ncbi:MAG: PH domain-containing protein [Planctomycetota bacterium]
MEANPEPSPQTQQSDESIAERKLHIATLVLPSVRLLSSSIVPAMVACLVLTPPVALLGFVGFVLIPGLMHGWIRHRTVRFAFSEEALVVKSGWIERVQREIPWNRIQEMKLEQPLAYRPFGLALIHATTAGQHEEEVRLDVVTMQQAERMLSTFSDSRPDQHTNVRAKPLTATADFECRLTLRDLVIGGMTSHLVAGIVGLASTLFYFQTAANSWLQAGDWLERVDPFSRLETALRRWFPDLGPFEGLARFLLEDSLGKGLLYVGFGLVVSVLAFVCRFYDFRLRRNADQLHIEHGLFARKRHQMSRLRLQTVQTEEGLLRRCFGLASVYADSAGDHQAQENRSKREVLLPIVSRSVASCVVENVFRGLSSENAAWRRPSPRTIGRGTRKGVMLVCLLILPVAGWVPVATLLALPACVVVYFLNRKWYEHSLYRVGRRYLVVRGGWLSRTTQFIPIAKVQNLVVSRSPFDRRLGLASLRLDTAGQSNTGGGPKIRDLTMWVAIRLHRQLASQIARQPFTW